MTTFQSSFLLLHTFHFLIPLRGALIKLIVILLLNLSTIPLPLLVHFQMCFSVVVPRAAYTAIPWTFMCVPWCDPDCTKALRLKRAAWNNYRYKRATPSQLSALISIKKTSACLRRTILNSWTIAGEIISPRLYLYLFQLSDVGSRQTSTLSSIFAILSSLIHSYPLIFQPG